MLVGFIGLTHLGQTLRQASEIRGFATTDFDLHRADLVFVSIDVLNHENLDDVNACMRQAMELPESIPVVLASQVPPGYTRHWLQQRKNLFYQVDTIIMNRALERATFPERIIVGCEFKGERLPASYLEWLEAFRCPIIKMGIESAELTKLAINYFLAKQIEMANDMALAASMIGASYEEMIPALRSDARIGQTAYIEPGDIGGHLPRDTITMERIIRGPAAC